MKEDAIALPDGRRMAYVEHGDPRGLPVLFCHGTPGSRVQLPELLAQIALALNLRIIVPDRPGYGLSDPKPGRKFTDWPQDAAALMQALDIEKFWMLGFSMGAPYALACAHALPHRVVGVVLAGGLAPNIFDATVAATLSQTGNALFVLARDNPSGFTPTLQSMAPDADSLLAALAANVSAPDQALLAQPQVAAAYLQDTIETLRQGYDAFSTDYILAVQPWGFELEAIEQPVHIWHGQQDINAPPAMAEHFAAKLPNSQLHWIPGAGHLALISHGLGIFGAIGASRK